MNAAPVGPLLAAASDGDQSAWEALVDRYAPLVWAVARGHRLDAADAADVSQTVWLRLVENLGRLREPEALAGWLVSTTRHECLRMIRRAGRETPADDVGERLDTADGSPTPEGVVVLEESRAAVWEALGTLSVRCQSLLRALSTDPDAAYAEVSAALGIPVGSIGPTRARCLEHLRRRLVDSGQLSPPTGQTRSATGERRPSTGEPRPSTGALRQSTQSDARRVP